MMIRNGITPWMLLVIANAWGGAASAQTERDLQNLVVELYEASQNVVIDGKGKDWSAIPVFEDESRSDYGDGAYDIIDLGIAPMPDSIFISIATAERPTMRPRVYWFDVDFGGSEESDIRVGINPLGDHTLWVYPWKGEDVSFLIQGIEVAIDEIVELRIPYDAILEHLPGDMRATLRHGGTRNWVRVKCFTWVPDTDERADYGPAAASHVLRANRYELDPPDPGVGVDAYSVNFMADGQWYVVQGAHTTGSHQDAWMYDFTVTDVKLDMSEPRMSKRNSDYYAWDQRIYAPAGGLVLYVDNEHADLPPRVYVPESEQPPANEFGLQLNADIKMRIVHFMQRGISIKQGNFVRTGDFVGRLGHSGSDAYPHLHVEFREMKRSNRTLPMALNDVRVSLNPGDNDPWYRELDHWDIREGFLVESLRKSVN